MRPGGPNWDRERYTVSCLLQHLRCNRALPLIVYISILIVEAELVATRLLTVWT